MGVSNAAKGTVQDLPNLLLLGTSAIACAAALSTLLISTVVLLAM